MQTNENILLEKKVDLNSEEAYLSQVLKIVVYNEFLSYERYSALINKLGEIEPFVQLKNAVSNNYTALVPICEKYDIDIPLNDCSNYINDSSSYIEACEISVAYELSNIKMYDHLLLYVQEDDIRDVLFQLQAASFNNHLPLFRKCVQDFYNQDSSSLFNQEDMMKKANEYQELLQDVASGNFDQDKITGLISKMNVSMISGAAFGAASSAFLSTYLNKNKE